MSKPIPVAEIFGPTIQGEGVYAGRPAIFVRTGGCGYRCSWCDSMHAVDPANSSKWSRMSPSEVVTQVRIRADYPILVVLTGGDPAMHAGLDDVNYKLRQYGYTTQVETQGALAADWLTQVDHVCISPKPPSSGMETDWDKLGKVVGLNDSVSIKVPIAGRADLAFADRVHELYPGVPFFIQPVNPFPGQGESLDARVLRLKSLAEAVKGSPHRTLWRVMPQLHVLMWGEALGV